MWVSRQFNRLRYFCSDAWDECRHSFGVNMLALGTLAASLFVAGLVMLVLSNVERRVQALSGDVRMDIYLADGHDVTERSELIRELEALPGVERVEFVGKDEALARYRTWAVELAELVSELDENPLPASLETYLIPGTGTAETATSIANRLRGRPAVEQVQFNQELLARLESLLEFARVIGIGLALLVFGAVIVVMASVLRLAVMARHEEIEIMHLVGATPGFIRGPFLVAGIAQGLLGGLAALAAVEGIRSATLAWGGGGSQVLQLLGAEPLPLVLGASLLVVGLVVSLAGSWFAVRRAV